MAQDQPKRRLFRLLRRTARSAASTTTRSAVEENALWLTHERAEVGVREAGEAVQRITSTAAKQRGTVESLADRSRATAMRAQDLSTSFARVVDAFERLGLVGLNAGLEGTRLGEPAGRALALVSDEVRVQATRGGESARELSAALTEVGAELLQVNSSLERTREASDEVAREATRAAASAATAERAIAELGERLRKATGSDPETVRTIAEATEHARALVTSLGTLSGKVPQGLVVAALRPVLEPLARLLSDGEPDEGSE